MANVSESARTADVLPLASHRNGRVGRWRRTQVMSSSGHSAQTHRKHTFDASDGGGDRRAADNAEEEGP